MFEMDEQPRCRPDRPVSVLLGAGAVRGLAHISVLRALLAGGFQITELVGTSAGAIVTAFYGAVGLDLDSIEDRMNAARGRLAAYRWVTLLAAGLGVGTGCTPGSQLARNEEASTCVKESDDRSAPN